VHISKSTEARKMKYASNSSETSYIYIYMYCKKILGSIVTRKKVMTHRGGGLKDVLGLVDSSTISA